MNATMNMGFQQPAVSNAPVTNVKNTIKNTPKSTDGNSDAPQKDFNEIFQEVSSETESKADAMPEKANDQMPGFSGMNNIAVLVDVSAIPAVQIDVELEMPTLSLDMFVSLPIPKAEVNAAAVQTGFADLLQNAKNPNLIEPPARTENAQPAEVPTAQNTGNASPIVTAEQALLNLLNGRNAQNATVLTQMQNQPQIPAQSQSTVQIANQQQVQIASQQQVILQETAQVQMLNQQQVQMASQQQVILQETAQVQMLNQPQTILQDAAAQAQMPNQPMSEMQSQLPAQPRLETPPRAANQPVKDKEIGKSPSPIIQNVQVVVEENNNPKTGQPGVLPGAEKKAAVEDILSPLPNQNETALKTAAIETANKGTEATQPQQFGQFVTSIMDRVRTESALPAQPTTPQTPESLAKYDIHGQIIEQARLVKTSENTQMVIKLRPEHLGELTLKVSIEHGVVNATFHSDNAQVRTMLETTMLQLKQELISQGIKVDNVGVYAGLGQFLSDGQGGQNGREERSTKFKNRKIDLADFEDEVDKVSGLRTANTATEDGVDYRI